MLMSVIKAATRPAIVNMVAKVYPVLFPLTFLIALLQSSSTSCWATRPAFARPTSLIVAASSLVLGGTLALDL